MMKYFSNKNLPNHLIEYLLELDWELSREEEATCFYPAGRGSHQALKQFVEQNKYKYYTQVPGAEFMADKKWLWIGMVRTHGRVEALKVLPQTWIIEVEKERKQLENVALSNPFQMIFLKSNKQQRKGIQLLAAHELSKVDWAEFKIAQLPQPTLKSFTHRPFHLRAYFVLHVANGQTKVYFRNEAKVLYGEKDSLITHSDTDIEAHLPQWLSEMSKVDGQINTTAISNEMMQQFRMVLESVQEKIDHQIHQDQVYVQLLGIDFIINQNRELKLLEVNFRPSTKGVFPQDEQFKRLLVKDYLSLFDRSFEGFDQRWETVI